MPITIRKKISDEKFPELNGKAASKNFRELDAYIAIAEGAMEKSYDERIPYIVYLSAVASGYGNLIISPNNKYLKVSRELRKHVAKLVKKLGGMKFFKYMYHHPEEFMDAVDKKRDEQTPFEQMFVGRREKQAITRYYPKKMEGHPRFLKTIIGPVRKNTILGTLILKNMKVDDTLYTPNGMPYINKNNPGKVRKDDEIKGNIRIRALNMIGMMCDPSDTDIIPVFSKVALDKREAHHRRITAIDSLTKIGGKKVEKLLWSIIKNDKGAIVNVALTALADAGSEKSVPKLKKRYLSHIEGSYIIYILGRIGKRTCDKRIEPFLLEQMEKTRKGLDQIGILYALADCGTEKSVERIRSARAISYDPDPRQDDMALMLFREVAAYIEKNPDPKTRGKFKLKPVLTADDYIVYRTFKKLHYNALTSELMKQLFK